MANESHMRLRRALLRIFRPSPLITVLISVPSFALVIVVLAGGYSESFWAYPVYLASAYALTAVVLRLPGAVRALRARAAGSTLIAALHSHPKLSTFISDRAHRAAVMLYAGLGINLAYAAAKLAAGVAYRSVWFISLAGYYLLLSLMRFALLRQTRGSMTVQWRRYRLCGCMLLIMNQALAVVTALVVYRSSGFDYPGHLIYLMAIYTFYAVINAVRSLFIFRSAHSPALAAAKITSFIAALVSMLSLETAMLARFGSPDDALFRRLITSITGGAVCTIVLVMAVFMMIRSTRQLRRKK